MNYGYAKFWRNLTQTEALEKIASCGDEEITGSAAEYHARACHEVYEDAVKQASVRGKDLPIAMVDFVLSMRDTHTRIGMKTAASNEVIEDLALKLAAAVVVDTAITNALPKLAGEEKTAALATRALGREWAVHLIGEMLK